MNPRVASSAPAGDGPLAAVPEAAVAPDAEFAEIIRVHHQSLMRMAWLLTRDRDWAEDLVADAFAAILPRWRAGKVADVPAYLRRTLVNRFNDAIRRLLLERARLSEAGVDTSMAPGPEARAAEADRVHQALMQLPRRQRTVIVLRYYEDLTERQTAEVMGLRTGSVKAHGARALARLRELLDERPAAGG